MKLRTYIFIFSILCFGSLAAQNAQLSQIQMDVAYLSADLLEGRETGTPGEMLAATYLAQRFEALGLSPKGTDGYFQSFAASASNNPHAKPGSGEARTGRNVVAFRDNGKVETIVIGAHFDHLGYGDFGSLHAGEPAIHNGADDNASGVAMILQLAELTAKIETPAYNFLFIGFSGEELGLFGSKHFVKEPTIELASINCMINLDMVGRLNEEKVLVINGVGTSPAWNAMLEKIEVHDIKITTTESGIGASDHTSFYLKDLPAVHFFTGQHKQYHKPEDDSHLVNYQGMIEVTDYIMALIQQLNEVSPIEFSKTKDESERQAARFKVSLGVMPDYTYQGEGMRVDAVLDGRAGKAAGMEDGDVVIKLGDVKVTDMYSYMEALSQFEEGQKAKLKVKRGEKEVSLKVTF
ncbi:MAG: M20/M25/M40 family metallo-hydrolase [Bacteroidia bacterium]